MRPNEQFGTMVIQDEGGTKPTVEKAVAEVRKLLEHADRVQRSTSPASRLKLGLECGGSDAYSGITANPALGAAADLLVRNGGTAVLSETPEIYGAEHLLTVVQLTGRLVKNSCLASAGGKNTPHITTAS